MATPTYAARFIAALTVALLVMASLARPAVAQEDGERVAVVNVEVLRSTNGASVVPVRVTVLSQRAIDAVLEVSLNQSNMRWELPIALAANSEVEQIITVPTIPGARWSVTATIFADGEELADDVENSDGANSNAVGVLGIAAPGLEAQLNPNTGIATLIELNDLRILSALDSVVVSPAGLQALTAEEQVQLMTWVSSGRQLLVADSIGSIDAVLPAVWQGDRALVAAGSGWIRYVGAADWDEQISPATISASSAQALAGGFDSSAQELLSDAGFRVPSLRFLALLLVVYLLIAGPVTFAVLTTKRKQTLAWVVIPVLAVLFTGGVFATGRLLNSGRSNAHATIVTLGPVGATVADTVLISRSGERLVELPDGWLVSGSGVSNRFGNQGAATPITIRPSRGTTDVRLDIEAGSGGLAILRGISTDVQDAFEVTDLKISNGDLTGSVQNRSGEDLEHVTMLIGARRVVIGSVSNGASQEFSLSLGGNPPVQFAPELRDWGVDPRQFNNFGFREELSAETADGSSNGTSWLEWRGSNFGGAVPEGLLTTVGWSRDLDLSLVGGRGRTALVQYTSLPASSEPLRPSQVRVIRMKTPGGDPFGGGFDGGFEAGGRSSMVTQFVVPTGSDSSELALNLQRNISELSVWVDDDWRAFKLDNGSGPSVHIPAEAWQGDTLTVRYGLSEFFGDPTQLSTRLMVVGENTENLALLPAGETSDRQGQFDPADEFGDIVEGVQSTVTIPDDVGETFEFRDEGELAGTFDTYVIELLEGDTISVRMNDLGGGFLGGGQLDPFLRLLGPAGEEVASNDDFDGLNSRIDWEVTSSGRHTIEARPLGGAIGGGTYEVEIELIRAVGES